MTCRSGGARQRWRKTVFRFHCVNRVVHALNRLLDRSSSPCNARHVPYHLASASVQDIWKRILRSPVLLSPASSPSGEDDWAALRALLTDSTSGYSQPEVRRSVVPRDAFSSSLVALPSSSVADVPLLGMIPPAMRAVYEHPSLASPSDSTGVLLHPAVARAESRNVRSYNGVPATEYPALVKRMLGVGMVELRPTVRCVNGLFGVWKDQPGGPIRLILDARPCNAQFSPCPAVHLPHPCRLGELSLRPGQVLWVSGLDLADYYHHLKVPDWMVPYFGLPPVCVADLGLSTDELLARGLSPTDMVYPAMLTLPMGFSHAVPLAQAVHEHALVTDGLFTDSLHVASTRCLAQAEAAHMVYIDDLNAAHVGLPPPALPPPSLEANLDAAAASLKARGLPENAKKRLPPTTQAKVLGVWVNGDSGRLHPHAGSLARLIHASRFLCRGPPPSPAVLRRVVGHWTWFMLVRRCSLSIFGHVYRYMTCAASSRPSLWPGVVRELRLACDLSPLIYSDLRAPMSPVVRAFDASSAGHASVYMEVPTASSNVLDAFLSTSGRTQVPGTAFADIPGWRSRAWRIARQGQWRFPEHINIGEMRAYVDSLELHARRIDRRDSRLILFGDSAVVMGACSKGRSGSPPLLGLMRRAAALQMAFGLFPNHHHIPSAANPADGPSRGKAVWN